MPGSKVATFKCHVDTYKALQAMAVTQDTSVNAILGTLVQNYVTGAPLPAITSIHRDDTNLVTNHRQLAMAELETALPSLVRELVRQAKAGDREAAIYCLDRLMGKPRQQVDQTVLHVPMDARYFQNEVKRLLGTDATPVVPPLLSEGNALPDSTDTPGDAESDVDSGT